MGFSDVGMRHIVDVDGQLLGIDAAVIDVPGLLRRARLPADSDLSLLRGSERLVLDPTQSIRLREDEVLFFETAARSDQAAFRRMAA